MTALACLAAASPALAATGAGARVLAQYARAARQDRQH